MPSKTIPRLALPGAVRAATALGLLVLSIEALSWKFALPGSLEVLGGIVTLWEEGKLQHDVAVSMVRWLGGGASGRRSGSPWASSRAAASRPASPSRAS